MINNYFIYLTALIFLTPILLAGYITIKSLYASHKKWEIHQKRKSFKILTYKDEEW